MAIKRDLKLTICVDQIKFDPEDTLTMDFNPATCIYFVYFNRTFLQKSTPEEGFPNIEIILTADQLNDNLNAVRIIAKDQNKPL